MDIKPNNQESSLPFNTRNRCSCSGDSRVTLETVFLIFQGDPGLQGPPGMRGRNGDDVSDIDEQYYGCCRWSVKFSSVISFL